MIFEGPCPFLRCLDTGWHAHLACLDCGAANSGNISCATCVRTWDISDDSKAKLLAAIEARGQA